MNTQTISLDIDKRHAIREPITIAQGDRNGTTIAATIYDGGTLVTTSGLSARFRMRLPDGRHFYEKTATWDAASGTATVTIDETQAASAPGTTSEAYFELLSGTTVIHSTSRFSVRVLRSATEGFDPATSYSDRVEELLDGLDELPLPGNAAPVMDGTANVGTSGRYARQDHRHPTDTSRASTAVATTSANGLMSATDKAKLNGIAANANAYELPPATASDLGGVKPDGTTITVDSDGTIHGASTYELPTMTTTTKGGAKLGDGLAITDGALGIDPDPQESTGAVRGAVSSLTAKGWATQDGTPTPSNPVPIEVARGRNLYRQTAIADGSSETVNNTVFMYYESHIFVNGTPSNNTYKPVSSLSTNEGFYVTLPAGTYTASISGAPSDDAVVVRKLVNGTNQVVNNVTYGTQAYTFTLTEETKIAVAAACKKDVPHDNVTIGIQLELGSTPTPYVPYGHVGVKLQSKNLAASSLEELRNNGRNNNGTWSGNTYTVKGIRFTVNEDGTITANGTSEANSAQLNIKVKGGGYAYISGCPIGGSDGRYDLYPWDFNAGARPKTHEGSRIAGSDFGNGSDVNFIEGHENYVAIRIFTGNTVSGLTFKPQVELGSQATPCVPYLNEIRAIPLPSKGFAASLPDGTADVLTIDGAGKVEWLSAVGHIESYAGESVGVVYLSTTGELTTGAEVYYPLATPATEDFGYIDWPDMPDGAVITCPELDDLGVRYLIGNGVAEMARQWYERAKSEYESRILALEQAVAELATA